jgi:hemoglobin
MLHRPASSSLLAVLALALLVVAAVPLHAQSGEDGDASLYQRIGGYDVIAAVVDDFFARFGEDPELVPFLGGINASEGARIRQRFVDFVCARTGGPCLYLGRDMRTTHDGLPITDTHFDRVMRHMEAAVAAQQMPDGAAGELISMLGALRSEILPR